MKKSLIWILFIVLLVGCKKENHTTVMDFDVTVSRIESHRVWLDVIPKDEFLPYYLDWMKLDDYNKYYASDQSYLEELSAILESVKEYNSRLMHNEGAFISAISTFPSTTYVLLISQLDGTRATMLNKKIFTSGDEHLTSFNLVADSIHCSVDGLISINPSDTDNTYFWDFELKKIVDEKWNGFHSAYFYYSSEFYYSMDFFPDILSRGFDEDSLSSYYQPSEIAFGDTICLMVVGYDETGETSRSYMPFWIVYWAPQGAVVIDADRDGLESLYRDMEGKSVRRIQTHNYISNEKNIPSASLYLYGNRFRSRTNNRSY